MDERRSSCCLIPSAGCCAGLFILFVCAIGVPAACIFALTTGGPDPLYDNVEYSDREAATYEQAYDQVVQQAAEGDQEFRIRFSDQELMSWMNLEFQDQLAEDAPDFVREDTQFQVRFEDGEVQSYIGIKFWDIIIDLEIQMRADFTLEPADIQTDTDKFDVTFTRFDIGRFRDVKNIESNFDEGITEALTDQLEGLGGQYEITDVEVDNGFLTITGIFTDNSGDIELDADNGPQ